MIDSLEIYGEALDFAKNNSTETHILKNYYLQIVMTTFYELTIKKTSPLLSALCQSNGINFKPKNFQILPAQITFESPTSADLFIIVHGLNEAVKNNLDSCHDFFSKNLEIVFGSVSLTEKGSKDLIKILKELDKNFGKNSRQDKDLTSLAVKRRKEDEKIIGAIKKVQLSLQEELSLAQNALKNISEIRDGIDFQTLKEPINQLIQLYDSIEDILLTHPQENIQEGYENLLDDCLNFKDYIEQALAMLGAEIIDETNVPYNPAKHIFSNGKRLSSRKATVSKILRVGFIYKGEILRKAEVEEENIIEDRN